MTMREYNYFTLGKENEYGQAQITTTEPVGQIRMCLNLTSQSIQDNINYKNAQYIGLTYNNDVDDTYIIEFGEERLKVLYVNHFGRLNQVFMAQI